MTKFQRLIIATLLLSVQPAGAATESSCPRMAIEKARPRPADMQIDDVRITGDLLNAQDSNLFTLTGNANLLRSPHEMFAKEIVYRRDADRVELNQGVRFLGPTMAVDAKSGYFLLAETRGELIDAEYFLYEQNGRGTAPSLEVLSDEETVMHSPTFTNCPPGVEDWQLKAQRIRLDQNTATGHAYHARVTFKGVPIFYAPYLQFPLSKARRSGFLMPAMGYSDVGGFDFAAPYYFNLAPNYDLLVTPRNMWRRGYIFDSHFRYLTDSNEGYVEFSHLQNDKIKQRKRGRASIGNRGSLPGDIESVIDLNWVSDDEYESDLNDIIRGDSTTHKRSLMQFSKTRKAWTFSALLENYQTLDDTFPLVDKPYRRLPQLNATWQNDEQLAQQFSSSFTLFDHPEDNLRDEGVRWHNQYKVSKRWATPGYFMEPRASLYFSHYQLRRSATSNSENLTRTLPMLELDSGIFLERDIKWFPQLLQTLEPRAYFVYTPYREQNNIPLFDTGERAFSVASLFEPSRFNGPDRIGDTKQLTLATTSRLFNPKSGRDVLSMSIGEIFYFADRQVGLNNTSNTTSPHSSTVAELQAYPSKFTNIRSAIDWDHENDLVRTGNLSLQFQKSAQKVVNLVYNYANDSNGQRSTDHTDFSFAWQATNRWTALGRWQYAWLDQQTRETFVGVAYQTCCWSVRMVNRRYYENFTDPSTDRRTFMVQLQLTGLAGLGKKIDTFMETGILGYRTRSDEDFRLYE